MIEELNTRIGIVEVDEEANYGRFSMTPLERGYGTTLGNSLRRILLSSLPGAAISNIKIDNVHHEFSTVKGVVDDVPEIILNVKGIAVSKLSEGPIVLNLDVEGPRRVLAKDISPDVEIEISNPEHYIATVNESGRLQMELTVVSGKGYALAEQNKDEDAPLGTIPIDSSFTPVKKVNFTVENTRVGQMTDYDKLTLEVWTNGTVTPQEAVSLGAQILIDHLTHFAELPNYEFEEEEEEILEEVDQGRLLSTNIEDLDLSLRSFNCLKRANIGTVGDIVAKSVEELWKIKNFGKKSFAEVESKMEELRLTLRSEAEEEDEDEEEE